MGKNKNTQKEGRGLTRTPEAMTDVCTLAMFRGGMTSPSRVAFPNALQLLFLAFQCALTSTGSGDFWIIIVSSCCFLVLWRALASTITENQGLRVERSRSRLPRQVRVGPAGLGKG